MPAKVNYGFQRAERDRAKQAKKEARAREKALNGSNTETATDEPAPDTAAIDQPVPEAGR